MAVAQQKSFLSYLRDLSLLKKLFWLYFILLIFEGALRKWVLPGLSAPLLIVRDPVGLMIIWEAFRTHKWPHRWSVVIQVLTVFLVGLAIAQVLFVDNPLVAAAFGLRSYLLPFPVAFIMGENLDKEDLRRFGTCTLFLLLPLTVLAAAQYSAPTDSFLNQGAYRGAKQITYVSDHVRASTTFSFVIGQVEYCTLAAVFIFYALIEADYIKKWLVWAGMFALLVAIPATGSRQMVFQICGVLACVMVGAMIGAAQFGKALQTIVPLALLALLASFLPVVSTSVQSMVERFSGADLAEGGSIGTVLYYRTFEPIVDTFEAADSATRWLGIGLGHGAVAVHTLLALNSADGDDAGEQEITHEFVEMGPWAAVVFQLFKILIILQILGASISQARYRGPLSLLMLPLCLPAIGFSLLEQPTEQGFMVIGIAFCIAAANMPAYAAEPVVVPLAMRRQQQPLLHRRVPRRERPFEGKNQA